MADFRVDANFFGHNKTKRLQRLLGQDGVIALMKFWAYASICKYDGEHIYTADDIELAVDWQGEPGAFVAVLASIDPYIRFIDAVDGGYVIHDWEEHNNYAATASVRTDVARNAANSRWKGKRGINNDAKEMQASCKPAHVQNAGICAEHNTHDAQAYAPHDANHAGSNAPSPSPSPVPSPSLCVLCDSDPPPTPAPVGAQSAKKKASNLCSEQFEIFWDAFADKRGRERAWAAWRKIKRLDRKLMETIIAGARRYASQRQAIIERKGTPKMAEGWLNDRRWEDESGLLPPEPAANPELDAAFARVMEETNG